MRHIETVRNYLNTVIHELLNRQELHDQSKFEESEVHRYDQLDTLSLRGITFGSPEYQKCLDDLGPALAHHYMYNRHHPQHFAKGINDMNLIDLVEMLVDWKASTLRHNDGDIRKSIEINQERFGYSDELKYIFYNTIDWLEQQDTLHFGNES